MNENNIISYKPDLNINGKKSNYVNGNSSVKAGDSIDIKYNNTPEEHTINFKVFTSYSPASTVNDICEILDDLLKKLNDIRNSEYKNEYMKSYFNAEDKDKKEEILNNNSQDMQYGSTVLEAYSYMLKMYEDLNNILSLYMKCTFGDNVDTSEVSSLMESYISQISAYESRKEYTKINYSNLYFDSQISYILSDFISQFDSICYDLSVIKDESNNIANNSRMYDLLKRHYDKDENKLKAVSYSSVRDGKEIMTALKNLFLAKQDLINDADIFATAYKLPTRKELVYSIQDEDIENVNEKVENLVKTCMNYNINFGDIYTLINDKSNCRKFF